MTQIGLSLAWCVLQVTLVATVGLLLQSAARRRSPQLARTVATGTFALLAILTVWAFLPGPRWTTDWIDRDLTGASARDTAPDSVAGPIEAPAARTDTQDDVDWATFTGLFWDEMNQPASSVTDEASSIWPNVLCWLVLSAVMLASLRIVYGIAYVRWLRRAAVAVDEPLLREELDVLQAECSFTQPVALYESKRLATAVTIGSRSPAILLPADWQGWSGEERRAVLAHELAHIRQRDYSRWLLAQVVLAFHFYHPIVHWLASSLRLSQEICADQNAARLSGGRRPYLQTLAGLALRQADRPVVWAAAPFLPTRRTFVRRIEMLRREFPKTASIWPMRTASLLILLATAVTAVGLRQQAAARLNMLVAAAAPASTVAPLEEDWSLKYVSPDTHMLARIQVGPLMQNSFASPVADMVRKEGLIEQAMGVAGDDMVHVSILLTESPQRRGPQQFMLLRLKNAEAAKRAMEHFGGSVDKPRSRPGMAAMSMDETTLLLGNSTDELRAYVASLVGNAAPAWAERWEDKAQGELALVYDLAALRTLINDEMSRGPAEAKAMLGSFRPLWNQADLALLTADMGDNVTIQVTGFCQSAEAARRVGETLQAALTLGKNMLDQQPLQAPRGTPAAAWAPFATSAEQLMNSVKISVENNNCVAEASLDAGETNRLVASMVPAVIAARKAATRMQSMNNLKQIALAFHNYHEVHKSFPPAVLVGPDGKTKYSWRVALLPYLDQLQLYRQYRFDEPWDSSHNRKVLEQMPPVFRDANAPESTNTSYFTITGDGTVFSKPQGSRLAEIRDGTSNTLLVVEGNQTTPWTKPEDIEFHPATIRQKLGGNYVGGFMAAFCDGSVRFLEEQQVSEKMLNRLIKSSDGEPVDMRQQRRQ